MLKSENQDWQLLIMKMNTNGRGPKNYKIGISQQPLVWTSSNLKLKLRGPTQDWNWNNEDDHQSKTTSAS